MKNRMMFLGSIIFASSVVFGDTLVLLPQPAVMVAQIPVAFEHNIASDLISRGIEPASAKTFAQNSVEDMPNASFHVEMLSHTLSVSKEDIYGYIASQSLFQNSVDLRAHDDVVGMLQSIKGLKTASQDLQSVGRYILLVS